MSPELSWIHCCEHLELFSRELLFIRATEDKGGGEHGANFKGFQSEGYWGKRSCGRGEVRGPEVRDWLALGGDRGGPKVGRFLWIMKRNVLRLGSEIVQEQSKMG